jgi:hypothetical protein
MSRLSNGGADELTMMLVETLTGSTTHSRLRRLLLDVLEQRDRHLGRNVMSNWPEIKPRMAVERLVMMVNSMPSRCGRPFFQ